MTTVESATASASGAAATDRFQADKSPFAAVKDVPKDRVDTLAREVLSAVHATIRKHQVTYDEYNALKAWLIQVGADEAKAMALRSAREEGILVGISSGATLAAIARKLPELGERPRVLGFNYDTGERYLSVPEFLPAEPA